MPFNGVLAVSVAKISAQVCQDLACLPERIGSQQMLDLVICFPLRQLGRWFLCLWTYLCVPPHPSYYYSSSYSDSEDDSASSSASDNIRYRYLYYNRSHNDYDDDSSHSD